MLAVESKAVGACELAPPPSESPLTWRQIVEPVEPFLRAVAESLAEQVEEFEPEIAAYARQALTSQGKQLRPALIALSAEAAGGLNEGLVKVASIIEMVHLATLVHDDVMDEAEIRRRRPTLAAQCGNSISVLVGDCLFAQAVRLAASFPTPEVCRAVAATTRIVCEGEILQNHYRWPFALSRREYLRVLRMKTAELFALSCDLGAGLSGAAAAERAALRAYGLALGTAYQVYDDCLDLFGSEAAAGKSLGTDLAGGKVTLPLIIALERATVAERKDLAELLRRWEPRRLPRLLAALARYDALADSCQLVHQLCRAARHALAGLEANAGREALEVVPEFLAQQAGALGVK
jgi:octaprenyl-diphosphate synthase